MVHKSKLEKEQNHYKNFLQQLLIPAEIGMRKLMTMHDALWLKSNTTTLDTSKSQGGTQRRKGGKKMRRDNCY